ncbi:type II secretion system F family protein [Paractinoplanes lichenicola]|uniref:Type II secretion system F family protein n=1 Tax=Paractinoplanes lichenicola TaxID=2802976 RepID=A0ABS1W622_9ACTN|nr:type II secretion system F family protein [Actinoplanes lichenicola]MBL7262189.1 type II secretion system F family protein [Actinoplanes lichenicola]
MNGPVLVAIATLASILAVAFVAAAATVPPSRRQRMLRILHSFDRSRNAPRAVAPPFGGRLRPPVVWALQRLGNLVTPPPARARLLRHLDYAGNPTAWPLDRVIRGRMVAGVVLGLLFYIIAQGIALKYGLPGAALGVLIGLHVPDLLAYNAGVKRQKDITMSLPDVLDAMVIGVESGLGLDAAMAQVAQLLRGPMPDELNRVLQEMRLGVSRSIALRALAKRTTVRDLKTLVTALVQAGELGISMAGILREHAADQRMRRRQRAEEQAQKVTVKLLFPVLFCLFPVIFIIVLGPAMIKIVGSL